MVVDTDLFVVLGMVTALLTVPSTLSALAGGRFPTIGLIVLAIGLCLMATGILFSPNGYSLSRLPRSFIEILARILN